jgi:hypothetical protein
MVSSKLNIADSIENAIEGNLWENPSGGTPGQRTSTLIG